MLKNVVSNAELYTLNYTEVLASIFLSYNDWYSDFELACLKELSDRAGNAMDAEDDDGNSYWCTVN